MPDAIVSTADGRIKVVPFGSDALTPLVSAASSSVTDAQTAAALSQEFAENPEDVAVTGYPGQYSALHHAAKAAAQIPLLEAAGAEIIADAGAVLDQIEAEYLAYGAPTLIARLINLENALGVGHTAPLPPEFVDDFSVDGNLNGRAGWAVETRPAFTGQINAISAASGKAGGTTGTAAFALHTAAAEASRVSFKLGNFGPALHMHVNVPATDGERDWINASPVQALSASLLSGSITIGKVVNGASSNIAIIAQWRAELGDTIEATQTEVSGVKYLTVYLNGQQAAAPIDITSWGGAFNKKHGIIGNIANSCDAFQVADPATEVVLRLIMPNRVVPINDDGSATWNVRCEYTGPNPGALMATVYDLSSGTATPITGLDRVPISSFTAVDGLATGQVNATAAQLASGGPFVFRAIREGLLTAGGALAESYTEGPLQTVGEVDGFNGQSLAVSASEQTITTDVYAQPANSHHLQGQPTGTAFTRYQRPVTANTTVAALAGTILALEGHGATIISGGVGGTAIAARGVGSACQLQIKESITRAGGKVHFMHHVDGQSDVTTATATYVAAVQAIYDDLAAYNGGTIRVLMHPIAAGWNTAGGTDENWQDIRRAQWKLTQDHPTRYYIGPYTLDLQHGDNLHLNANAYGVMQVRAGYARSKALGTIANDRNGPSLYSVTRVDAQTVYCLYDLNGADSLELVNSAYASEYHGGMVYSTAATKTGGTIATRMYPTGATVDASATGTRWGITFTFATNSFPGTVYAWASYGKDPFNPNNTGAIQTDMAGKASMIRGVYSDGTKVALRPRFTTDSLDYMSAS